MDEHFAALKRVCRVGGARISSVGEGREYPVTDFVDELQTVFGIDAHDDESHTHPPSICRLCERVIHRVSQEGATYCGGGCGPPVTWSSHQRKNCSFCSTVRERSKGGRPKKKKKPTLKGSALQAATTSTRDCETNISSSISNPTPVTVSVAACDTPLVLAEPLGLDTCSTDTCEDVCAVECDVGHKDTECRNDSSSESLSLPHTLHSTADNEDVTFSGMDTDFEELLTKASPSYKTTFAELEPDRFTLCPSDLVCGVCHLVVDQMVETPCCKRGFCAVCISYWLESCTHCPLCNANLYASALSSPHPIVKGILSELVLSCDFYEGPLQGCPERVQLMTLSKHVETCDYHPNTTHTAQPRVVGLSSSVSDVLTSSPSKLRGNVCEQLTKHLVTSRAVGDRLELRNTGHGGRPTIWTRTPIPLVDSAAASERSKRRRASQLRSFNSQISGGREGAFAQSAHELKSMGKKERDGLLEKAKLKALGPAAGSAMAIKSDLHLPWYQLRKLQKWFVSFGISLESERVCRQYLKDVMPKYMAEEVPMTSKQGVSLTPMVYIKDLSELIVHLLNLHDEANTLVWHEGMAEEEIWVKFCGDHGGSSFKLCLQILNILHPNSVRNTVPLCVFTAKDTPSNLQTALGLYREQLSELSTKSEWKGKTFKVLLSGDYEFLTTNFGLSGSSGVRPCLFCVCEKKAMQAGPSDRETCTPRSLTTLQSDYESFQKAGGNLARAKYHNNVIRPAILPFPLYDVCIPTLHLDLGIYPWMYDALCNDVRELDLLLATATTLTATDSDTDHFKQLATAHKDLQTSTEQYNDHVHQCNNIQEQLSYLVLHAQRHGHSAQLQAVASTMQLQWQSMQQQVSTQHAALQAQKAKVTELESKGKSSGPCYLSLDKVLTANNIQRQAYHGGAFIGNHVHHALLPDVIRQLTAAPLSCVSERIESLTVDKQQELSHLRSAAEQIQSRYSRLMNEFAQCRKIYSTTEKPTAASLQTLSDAISKFLATCRTEIVSRKLGNVTPKLHLLECHLVDCMAHFNVGLGLLNEQGSESIHSAFNKLERMHSSVVTTLSRLKSCTEAHLHDTLPKNAQLRPATATRKRKRPETDDVSQGTP